MTDWIETPGRIVAGHRIASGGCHDPRFPRGTIALQLPYFTARIPGFAAYLGTAPYAGTINLDLIGRQVLPGAADAMVEALAWTPHFPPETFHLSRCQVRVGGDWHPAWAYQPDPATKPDHHQAPSIFELIAAFIPGLAYGQASILRHARGSLKLAPAG